MNMKEYKCPKCDNKSCDIDQMAATGGGLSKMFDIQNKKFTTVTCTHCKYTEFFKAETSLLGNIFDFITN